MMSARLSSLIVSGGVVLMGICYPVINAATSTKSLTHATLIGATFLEVDGGGGVLKLDVPDFIGNPKVQVLNHPNRVVVDLPGVIKGVLPSRQDIATWRSPLIQKARLAQFSISPLPVTRLVFEVPIAVDAKISRQNGTIFIELKPGTALSTQVSVVPETGLAPLVAEISPAVAGVDDDSSRIAIVPDSDKSNGMVSIGAKNEKTILNPIIAPNVEAGKGAFSIPAIPVHTASLRSTPVTTLLPATIEVLTQEKGTSTVLPAKREDTRGRTLGDAQGRYSGSKITIDVKGAELSTFLRIIADHAKLNLVADQDVQGIYDFKFTETPWDQVLDIIVKHANLGMEISNGVIRVAKIEKLQKEEDDRKKLTEAKALAGDLTTITRPLSFAKASEAKVVIEKLLSKRGTLIIDDRTNVLIISDLAKNLPIIDDLIQQLDVQIQQVQIEARIVEANGNYEKAFGVKWPTSNSQGGAAGPTGGNWGALNAPSWNSINSRPTGSTSWQTAFSGGNNGVTSLASPAGELWVSFLSNRLSVNVVLQALEKDGKIRIVSNPKVVTQNNKKATILSGAKIPYPTRQSGGSDGAITVSFADANLQLDVTPQITNDGTIIMDLKIEKAEADFSASVNGTPSILRKYIETQVLVKDGGTAVLGGIYTTATNAQTTGVPFLSKIPVLGLLFRTKSNKENNAELLVFITPRILKL